MSKASLELCFWRFSGVKVENRKAETTFGNSYTLPMPHVSNLPFPQSDLPIATWR
jgi:hypothetical protein